MASPGSAHVSEETWEAFALGELPPGEREAVAGHIVTCAECSSIYRSLRQLEDEARAFDPGVPAAPVAATHLDTRTWFAMAATLLVAAGLAGYGVSTPSVTVPGSSSPATGLARFEIAPAEVRLSAERAMMTRGPSSAPSFLEEFGRATAPYRDGRYGEAARALAAMAAAHPDAYEPVFYQGVASLMAGEDAAALTALRRAAELAPASLQDEIRWYRAAALQRTGAFDEATDLLRELCAGASALRARACGVVETGRR